MWNDIQTGRYEGMLAETVRIAGYNGEAIHAYYARPLGAGPHPGVVLIPHMPGWDEFCREASRRFAQHGYAVLCPDIYCRVGHGRPDEVAAKSRGQGGLADESVVGDCAGARDFLRAQPTGNGKVGVIGMCSGGRHAFLAACQAGGFDAAVDCWGGNVYAPRTALDGRSYTAADFAEKLDCPLLGIFGNEDKSPPPEEVDRLEADLERLGKDIAFHRYDGAGHGIWYYHTPMYRQAQAMDSWEKVFAFFEARLR
ncbi:MAG: dienelactone hydrolase family protein [Christensenellales bacterium]|jgi:carboxymethylenebutenolidase